MDPKIENLIIELIQVNNRIWNLQDQINDIIEAEEFNIYFDKIVVETHQKRILRARIVNELDFAFINFAERATEWADYSEVPIEVFDMIARGVDLLGAGFSGAIGAEPTSDSFGRVVDRAIISAKINRELTDMTLKQVAHNRVECIYKNLCFVVRSAYQKTYKYSGPNIKVF